MAQDMGSTTIEFFRFGNEAQFMEKGKTYIRTCGYQKPADQIAIRIEPKEFRRSLNQLRYKPNRTAELEAKAQQLLCGEAEWFLPASLILPEGSPALYQVDIVTHASELRAYPFEAIYANASGDHLESPDRGMILTRRIRSEFSYAVPPWPEVPSVLFAHAQVDDDLSPDLIDQHRQALCDALAPWGNPQDLERNQLLVVREVESVEALERIRMDGSYSYVHILAHGARVPEEDMEEYESEWGLRLGRDGTDAAAPRAIASALKLDKKGYPLVVTLAACDSATSDPELGNTSLVESLHRSGIPVVIASQFPLTKSGSITLTREFYRPLLSGEDVRRALHAARVALRKEARSVDERRHDWLSLVGYVRLPPEGYAQYLKAFSLRVELHMLEAARKGSEPLLSARSPSQAEFDDVERRLGDRITQLRSRKEALERDQDKPVADRDRERALAAECAGLLASGCKSLAELRFLRARHFPQERARYGADSKAALVDSLKWYTETYELDLSRHWHGIQKLALEAALQGGISEPLELAVVRLVAQNACDRNPSEYWACGTLAEAILLGAMLPQGFDAMKAQAALVQLRERSVRDATDNGFAVNSTLRQLQRYVNWWTKPNGYFPGRSSDLSVQAQALVKLLLP